MYDAHLFQQAMAARGLNPYRLSLIAGVDFKTAKSVVATGKGNPDSVYAVAMALGLAVRKFGRKHVHYDFTAIMKNGNRKKSA